MSTLPQPNKVWLVAAAHEGRTGEALALAPGDALTVGPVFQDDPEWPDWHWCTDSRGREGWVPQQVFKRTGPTSGIARRTYSARELAVRVGDVLRVREILNGWAWSQGTDGQTGWVPLKCLQPAPERHP